jgi:hypothetical protein
MGTLSLKSPLPPTALKAMARASGTASSPKPGKANAHASDPSKHKAKLSPLERAVTEVAAVQKMPRQTPADYAKYKYAKALAGVRLDWIQRREGVNQRAAWRAADLALCREQFPRLFDPDHPVPLAVGIHRELAPRVGFKRAQRLMAWWTAQPAYVAAIAAGGNRYRLDGSIAGEITRVQRGMARGAVANNATAQLQEDAAQC